eukprot:SAG22_NODE_522_length_9503_cov_4.233624_6_plen_211_part_00
MLLKAVITAFPSVSLPFLAVPLLSQPTVAISEAMNSTAGLDASCVAAAAVAGKSAGQACTLPEDVAPHIQVPLFTMNSKYDPAMISISSTSKGAAAINALAARFVGKVEAAVFGGGQKKNGAFITGCEEHCGQWAQGQVAGGNSDFNATIDGTTAPFAVQAWFAANKAGKQSEARQFVHMATARYPCEDCCFGGDGESANTDGGQHPNAA